jgi:hydrogenase/urease accessory protein HupE
VSRRGIAAAAAVAIAIAWPASARAHLVQSGLGPFYDGIAHFALSPDDWLLALALALLGGLGGARGGRTVLFVLPAAWLLGGAVGLSRDTVAEWPVASAATLVLAGALVAWSPTLDGRALSALAFALGALHGYLNGSLGATGGFTPSGLLGVASTVFVLAALAAALVVSLRREPLRIVVRVAGSWIAAIGILLVGWSLR